MPERWSDERIEDFARRMETRINGIPERVGILQSEVSALARSNHEDLIEIRREQREVREALEKSRRDDAELLREQLRRRTIPPAALLAAFATLFASIIGAAAIILTQAG